MLHVQDSVSDLHRTMQVFVDFRMEIENLVTVFLASHSQYRRICNMEKLYCSDEVTTSVEHLTRMDRIFYFL